MPLTWVLKEVNLVGLHRQSTLSVCLESLRNRTPSNLKLYHISKNPWQKKKNWRKGPHNLTSTGPHLSYIRHWVGKIYCMIVSLDVCIIIAYYIAFFILPVHVMATRDIRISPRLWTKVFVRFQYSLYIRQYSDTSDFSYIFHIKLQFLKKYYL
jgi:hypothetical protein